LTTIEHLSPAGVPAPRGPYSAAVRAGDYIFVSGQVPVDPATNELSTGDIQEQTRMVLNNVSLVLDGAGATMADVVRVGVYLGDGNDFAAMNEVYAEFFGHTKPARSTIVCSFIAAIKVEIDCIVYKPAIAA
jgi:2-iminobutanoate/2-iminopropanoate deaminase